MIEKEINEEEFDNTNTNIIKTPTETLKILKNKYPKEYKQTIHELTDFCKEIDKDNETIKEYTEQDIHIIFGAVDIIEYMDDLFEDEILINYYSNDNCGTDRGIWEMTTRYGYAII